MSEDTELREQVRARYAQAATAVTAGTRNADLLTEETPAGSCCAPTEPSFGAGLYDESTATGLPLEAVEASLGCGNPTAVAELHEGERVLDLGSGGGIDVLLSAKRVGPTGFAYGVDMTDEMLELAEKNRAEAAAENVTFLKGTIEEVPLPDGSVDVVISNCVINLSTDKPAVLTEMFRVLTPGGRIGISDVVAEDRLTPAQRAERGSYVGCIAGALSKTEYLDGLTAAGQVGAAATALTALGVSHTVGALLGTLLIIGFTVLSGMWGVAITDFIQFWVIAAGLVLVTAIAVNAAGGLGVIADTFTASGVAEPFNPLNQGWPFFLGAALPVVVHALRMEHEVGERHREQLPHFVE